MRNLALILFFSVFSLASEEDLINKISKILPTGLPINFIEESSMPDFYVVNVANNQIYTVDISTNELTDSIPISGKPICIKEDNLNRLWILSRGDIQNNINSNIKFKSF